RADSGGRTKRAFGGIHAVAGRLLSAARPIGAQFHCASGLSLLPGPHGSSDLPDPIAPAACLGRAGAAIPAAEIDGLRSALRRRVPAHFRVTRTARRSVAIVD